jgi:acetyl esterase
MPRPEPLVDPALAALLADPRIALRPPPPGLSLAQYRAAVNGFLARALRPPVAVIKPLAAIGPAGNVSLRLYAPRLGDGLPLVVFVHGGGFVFGDLDTHDAMCRRLAIEAEAAVVAIDYRLAPEHPFPAALEDCRAAFAWLVANADALGLDSSRIAVAGDSAGGQLAAAMMLDPGGARLRHLALIYPLIDPARTSASQRVLDDGYMLTGGFLDWAWQSYAKPGSSGEPGFDLTKADVKGLPPTTIITAQFDPLRDEGEVFAARLRDAGVATTLRRYDGMIHGFAGLPQFTPVAAEAIAFIGRELRTAFAR